MTKHTPGPLVVETDGKGFWWVDKHTADGGFTVADTGHGPDAEANARFIAIAPEMFEALKAARDQIFDGLCAQGEEDPITPQVLAVLDDIIDKAEGE